VWGQPPSAVHRAKLSRVPGFSFLKPCGDSRPRLSVERSSTICDHQALLPTAPVARDQFVKSLEHVRQCYEFAVVGYVVMPEHFHLLISEPEKGTPSVVIQALKLGVVRRPFPTSRKSARKPALTAVERVGLFASFLLHDTLIFPLMTA
jgi:hypothetical protein